MKEKLKKSILRILDMKGGNLIEKTLQQILILSIVISVLGAIFDTVPEMESIHTFFGLIENITITIFCIEYIARIWTANMRKGFTGKFGRIEYALTPTMLFDLMVILPFFVHLFFPHHFNIAILRFFRLLRILRILRIGRYSSALSKILGLFHRHKEDLIAIFTLMISIVTILSTLMYFIENGKDPNNPHHFSSIPDSIWWGIITLSTIGYGDITPITPLGKILGSITALFGVAIFALPTAILGASFYAEIKSEEKQKIQTLQKEIQHLEKIIDEMQHGKKTKKKFSWKKILPS